MTRRLLTGEVGLAIRDHLTGKTVQAVSSDGCESDGHVVDFVDDSDFAY